MSPVFYTEINLFSIVLLTALLIIAWSRKKTVEVNVHFLRIVIMVIAVMSFDILIYLIDGGHFRSVRVLLIHACRIYFILTELAAFTCLTYIRSKIQKHGGRDGGQTADVLTFIPALVFFIILIGSDLIFYIDEMNNYQRGSLFSLQYIIGFSYIAASSILSLSCARREKQTVRKMEYYSLSILFLFPIIGGMLQILKPEIIVLWPVSSAALLLIYIKFQRNHISVDPLTGLKRRNYMISHMRSDTGRSKVSSCYLIIIDIDEFRKINAGFGHSEGDSALKMIADAIRSVFTYPDAICARYGGDEFAVKCDADRDEDVEVLLEELDDKINSMCEELPYKVSISSGYAAYDRSLSSTIDGIIAEAENQMYFRKRLKREECDFEPCFADNSPDTGDPFSQETEVDITERRMHEIPNGEPSTSNDSSSSSGID